MIDPVLRSGTLPRMRCIRRRVARALLLLSLPSGAAALRAQQRPSPADSAAADSASRDSIAARLRRAEAAIELLRQQLAVEASTVVRTRSRLQIELSARVLMNSFLTSNRVNNVDVPQFGLPRAAVPPTLPGSTPPGSPGTRALGISVRQTRLGAAMSVDSVLGGVFEGDIDLDFFGGVSTGPGDRRLFPEPRLRTARARLRWDRGSVLIGSETPLISDLNPVSLASVGVPGFVTAGNLWNWLPQVRISRDLIVTASGVRVGLQGAVLAPFSNTLNSGETDAVDAGERSGRPYLQSRVNVRWGDGAAEPGAPSDVSLGGTGGELGVGMHRGWVRAAGDSTSVSSALSIDGRVMIAPRVEIRGEAYRGQLVRGLGGGAIGQGFGRSLSGGTVGPPLRDVAGWVQLNVQAHATLISGAGCGRNSVNRDDRPIRLENTACAAHLLWRPAQPLVLGMEFRQVRTRYSDQTSRANHMNLSFGFEL